jgi:hypothetical protein
MRRQLGELFGNSFKLEIDSEIGAGTRAALSLPLQIDSASSVERSAARSRIGGTSATKARVEEKANSRSAQTTAPGRKELIY